MDWITGIQAVINYIEDHLTEELNYDVIAKRSIEIWIPIVAKY